MTTGRSVNITKGVPVSFFTEDFDVNIVKPPDYPVGPENNGLNALLSDGRDIWSVSVRWGGKSSDLKPAEKKEPEKK
jgi:hypothetical protein